MNADEVDFQTWHDEDGEPVPMFAFVMDGANLGVEIEHCLMAARLREHDPEAYEEWLSLGYLLLERMPSVEGMDA